MPKEDLKHAVIQALKDEATWLNQLQAAAQGSGE
jgi:hypothetical protein